MGKITPKITQPQGVLGTENLRGEIFRPKKWSSGNVWGKFCYPTKWHMTGVVSLRNMQPTFTTNIHHRWPVSTKSISWRISEYHRWPSWQYIILDNLDRKLYHISHWIKLAILRTSHPSIQICSWAQDINKHNLQLLPTTGEVRPSWNHDFTRCSVVTRVATRGFYIRLGASSSNNGWKAVCTSCWSKKIGFSSATKFYQQ